MYSTQRDGRRKTARERHIKRQYFKALHCRTFFKRRIFDFLLGKESENKVLINYILMMVVFYIIYDFNM